MVSELPGIVEIQHGETASIVTLTFDLSSSSLLIKSFDIPALTHLKRSVDKHLKKWQPSTCMDFLCLIAILWRK